MPPRRSQRIAAASSTSRPTRSATPKSIPAAPPVPKPAAKRRRMATPESEEDDVEDDADADDDDDSGNATDGETAEDKAPAPRRKEKRAKGMASDSAVQEAPSQWKRVRGKRGILQKMTDTPLDVLFEVRAQLLLVFAFVSIPVIDILIFGPHRFATHQPDYQGSSPAPHEQILSFHLGTGEIGYTRNTPKARRPQ